MRRTGASAVLLNKQAVQRAQARDAERYTRLVRKKEPGAGPLRYSIELRRSAGEAFYLVSHRDRTVQLRGAGHSTYNRSTLRLVL